MLETLQQYLPFTVLKPTRNSPFFVTQFSKLQQYLPFTVLKLLMQLWIVAISNGCNSTYRLRY